jgi:hypothetical protein
MVQKCYIVLILISLNINEFIECSTKNVEYDEKMHPNKRNLESLFGNHKHKFVGTDFEKSMEFWNFVAQLKLRHFIKKNLNVLLI